MANKPKIVGEVEILVRSLCEKGYNPTYISKKAGVAKDTVKKWALKHGYSLSSKISNKYVDLEPQILEMLKDKIIRKHIQKTLKVSYDAVTRVAVKYGLEENLRTRLEAAQDKVLTESEIKNRLPDNSEYLGYNKESKLYLFRCIVTNKIFKKTAGKIYQGSPYGKNGKSITEEEFSEKLKTINHTLEPGTFTKTKSPAIVYCSRGHKRELQKAIYALKFNCAQCNNRGISNTEKELMDWVRQFYPSAYKFKFEDRKTKPQEIDIYIPELKLGIEYCGLYWHGESDIKDGGKHYNKMLKANQEGIRLITIFENEWNERQDQVKSFLLSAMNKNSVRIGARDCSVGFIEISEYSDFMETYHIQGADSKPLYIIGLKIENELVGAMSFGKHPQRHSVEDNNIYLNRMAFKQDVTISGGASKMFEFAKKELSGKYSSIISWSDNRWSEGSVYKSLGFEYKSQRDNGTGLSDGSIWPDFKYAIGGKLYTRNKVRKMNLDIEEGDLIKVYDCGKKRWEYKL